MRFGARRISRAVPAILRDSDAGSVVCVPVAFSYSTW